MKLKSTWIQIERRTGYSRLSIVIPRNGKIHNFRNPLIPLLLTFLMFQKIQNLKYKCHVLQTLPPVYNYQEQCHRFFVQKSARTTPNLSIGLDQNLLSNSQ
jgi:hypothetical protein